MENGEASAMTDPTTWLEGLSLGTGQNLDPQNLLPRCAGRAT